MPRRRMRPLPREGREGAVKLPEQKKELNPELAKKFTDLKAEDPQFRLEREKDLALQRRENRLRELHEEKLRREHPAMPSPERAPEAVGVAAAVVAPPPPEAPPEAPTPTPAEVVPPEAPAPEVPPPPEAPRRQTLQMQAGAVETSQIVEHMARERAEDRLNRELNARGFRGLWTRVSWRWMEEGYRQRYIALERQNIRQVIEGGQAQQGTAERVSREAVSAEQQAILERFLADYQGLLATGEVKREEATFNEQLKNLVSRFVSGQISEAELQAERNNLLNNLRQNAPDLFEQQGLITDNLLERALELKAEVEHAGGLANIDLDIRLTLGRARAGTRTEADLRTVDRLVNRLQTSPVLRWAATPLGIATVAGGAYSILNNFARIGGGKIAALATWGASVLAASGFAAARRGTELKRERAMHIRQRAMSMDQDEETRKLLTPWRTDTRRRERMDEMTYEMRSAISLQQDLQNALEQVQENGQISGAKMSQDRLNQIIQRLAEVDARMTLSDGRNIDLISYSQEMQIEQERTPLLLATAKAKAELRHFLQNNTQGLPQNLEQELANISANRMQELLTGAGGINELDQRFTSFRRREMAHSALTAAAIGLGVGTAMQEGIAYFSDSQQGWIEGMIKGRQYKGEGPVRLSALESLRAYMSGDLPKPVTGGIHEVVTDGVKMKIPDGTSILQQGSQEFLTDDKGDKITEIVRAQDGSLSPQTAKDLADHGFRIEDHVTSGSTKVSAMEYFKDELGTHKRVDWHDELGKRYSEFFKKLIEFEGKQQMLYMEKDASGQVFVNVDAIMKNVNKNLDGLVDQFGRNPDGSFDSKLLHLKQELEQWRANGTLKDHLQVAIIPTEEANKKGLSMLVEGAGGGNKLALPKEVSDLFKTPESLKYLHHPVKYIEFRINGHVIATTVGENMADITVPAGLHTPDIIPPIHGWEFVPPPHLPFAGRRPLEPLRREGPAFFYYGSSSPEAIQREFRERGIAQDTYTSTLENDQPRFLDKERKKVKRNVEREKQRVQKYLESQDPNYLQELKQFNQNLEPMHEACRVAIIVPARFEKKNLANLLNQYTQQRDHKGQLIDKDLFEINIIVNRKKSEKADNSVKVINDWKRTHPDVRVNVVDIAFDDDKACVGLARKYVTDLSLLRLSERRKQTSPLYIESEDGDLFSVDKRTVWKLIRDFDQKPYLDVLRGLQDRRPDILQKNDLLFFRVRLWDFLEIALRNSKFRPENNPAADFTWHRTVSGGWNTAFTAELYAQIGGYNPTLRIGEDMDIGQKASVLRGSEDTRTGKVTINTRTAETSGLRSSSSPRRFIDSIARDVAPYDIAAFENQRLKHYDLEELLEPIKAYSVAKREHLAKYQQIVDGLIGYMRTAFPENSKEWKAVAKRALFYFGLKPDKHFQLTDTGITLKPEGMDEIAELLNKYRRSGSWKKGYRRQSSPFEAGEPR